MNFYHHVLCIFIFYSADYYVYQNGVRRPQTFTNNTRSVTDNRMDYDIVFGRLETTRDQYYCNCEVDNAQIFEMELNSDEVNKLYNSN